MNTELLRTFLAIVHSGSFTKASQQLHVVQSTASNRIKELEKEIGQPLLNRSGFNVELTSYGKAFLPYAENILELENRAYDAVYARGQFSEHLNVGSVFYHYETLLSHSLKGFCSAHPCISIRVRPDVSTAISAGVHDGALDFGYIHHHFNHPRFICRRISTDNMLFVTGGNNTAHKKGIESKTIKNLPIVYSSYLDKSTYEWLFNKHHVFALDITVGSMVIPFLTMGDAYSFLPRKLVEKQLKDGSLIEIPLLDKQLPPLETFILFNKESAKSTEIETWENFHHPHF